MEPLSPADPHTVGPYALLGRLGAGGMGVVYLGRSGGGRVVAVKLVRPDIAEEFDFRERFAREVAAARAVSGAFTAPVVDADPLAETPWMATAFVPGINLHDAVARLGPLSEDQLRVLGLGLLEALTEIHRAGLTHRDLKPGNVLLALDGPHVIDFGISRPAGASTLTQVGVVLGSPGYLAPEQVTGGVIGPAGDVFCLAATLVFAATGHGPFGTGSAEVLLYRGVHAEPDLSDVPAGLRPALLAMLVKDPALRPGVLEASRSLGPVRSSGRRLPQPYLDAIEAASAELRWMLEQSSETDPWGLDPDTDSETSTDTETAIRQPEGVPQQGAPQPVVGLLPGAGAEAGSGPVSDPVPVADPVPVVEPVPEAIADAPTDTVPGSPLAVMPLAASPAATPTAVPLRPPVPMPSPTPTSTAPPLVPPPLSLRIPAAGAPRRHPTVTRRRLLAGGAALTVTGIGALIWDLVEPGGGGTGNPNALDTKSPSSTHSLSQHPENGTGSATSATASASGATAPAADSIAAGTIYAGFNDGRIVALDAATGKVRWNQSAANGAIYSPPLYAAGSVYTGSADDTRMFALNATTGAIDWRFSVGTNNGVYATPGYQSGVVYCATDVTLYALLASTGTQIWAYTADGTDIRTMPLVVNGVVYIGSLGGTIHAVNATTGKQKWSANISIANNTSFAVTADTLYCTDANGVVQALRLSDGSSVWHSGAVYAVSTPVLSGNVIYVGGYQAISALNAASGQSVWAVSTTDYVFGAPAAAGTSVYVPVNDGHVVSLSYADGSVQWTKQVTTYNIDAPALVANGMVYVSAEKVYALDAASGAPKWNYALAQTSPDGGISLGRA
jgi:outer membrane protein assembly factor BamB/serine/threonine protein kinase